MNVKGSNPLDFERDLPVEELRELALYTQWARQRLSERSVSIAERKQAFFNEEKLDRPPLLIADFPARLIGIEMYDYYVDTVAHYKAYCAALARFGEEYVYPYTTNWEYRLVEALGGSLAEMRSKAPETIGHPLTSPKDLEKLPPIDVDQLVAEDLALKRYLDRQLGDLLGPGGFVSLDPFSQVCALLRDPQELLMDVIRNPGFVHALCEFIFEVQRQVLRRVQDAGPAYLFAPGYTLMLSPKQFQEFALPYIERLVAEFPGVPMLVGSGGDATHLIQPLMESSVPVPFLDAAANLDVAVEQAKAHNKPITVLFPRSVLMGKNRDEIRATTRQLLQTAKAVRFFYWTEAILGGDVPNPAIDLFVEAYRDYAHYPIDEYLGDEPAMAAVEAPGVQALNPQDVVWTPDGEAALKKSVPIMFRTMAKRDGTKKAASRGIRQITAEVFEQFKEEAGY